MQQYSMEYSIKRALLSVTDKTNLELLAKFLVQNNVEIISTGGTAELLQQAQIPFISISEFTGFPEIMSGRVKTLHPKVHAGILGLRDKSEHLDTMLEYGMQWIDLVVCNLYDFDANPCIENIDIGGITLLRAAAKNYYWVTVLCDVTDYSKFIEFFNGDNFDLSFRKSLAAKAFTQTAYYDALIARYFSEEAIPTKLILPLVKIADCRYGENPHQKAGIYKNMIDNTYAPSILDAVLLQGDYLSYNNYQDAASAINTLVEYNMPACAIIKHNSPCGVAISESINSAFEQAWYADEQSAFGGVIALNQPCTQEIAKFLSKLFIEIIIAPDFVPQALEIFKTKNKLKVLQQNPWPKSLPNFKLQWIPGGMLMQSYDNSIVNSSNLKVVTQTKPTEAQLLAMQFAWPILKQLKSNAILIADQNKTISIGAGQVSRINAVNIAINKIINKLSNNCHQTVLASDAFFPFADNIECIAKTPIKAIMQPGGSIKDREIIAACDRFGIAMVFTGVRCFNH